MPSASATLARSAAEKFIGGDPHEAGGNLDYFVWLLRSSQRTWVRSTPVSARKPRRAATGTAT